MPSPSVLTVVVPTYNRRELTLRAVRSVLAQHDAPALDVIVADDGSTDDTAAAVREAFRQDPRVQVSVGPHGGASAARNRGFALARGELVAFLDSDDYWLEGTLRAMLAAFSEHPDLAFVCVDGATLPHGAQPPLPRIVAGDSPGWSHPRFAEVMLATQYMDLPSGPARLISGDFLPAIMIGDLFYLSGMLMRRDHAAAAGPFNERFRYYNDWEFFARLCMQGRGAYLEYDGFRRDSGRADQISRRRPPTTLARRHLYILHAIARHAGCAVRYHAALDAAFADAHYAMARRLSGTRHARWARRYLHRCLRRRHRLLRTLVLLAGFEPSRIRIAPDYATRAAR